MNRGCHTPKIHSLNGCFTNMQEKKKNVFTEVLFLKTNKHIKVDFLTVSC